MIIKTLDKCKYNCNGGGDDDYNVRPLCTAIYPRKK